MEDIDYKWIILSNGTWDASGKSLSTSKMASRPRSVSTAEFGLTDKLFLVGESSKSPKFVWQERIKLRVEESFQRNQAICSKPGQ